jgi:small subunit ribosomal protein S17
MTKITKTKSVKTETTKMVKKFSGIVVSDKMKDTVVVDVARFVKHPKYGKFMKLNKNIKAHDAGNTKKIGEKVTIEECRPISKGKYFKVVVS